MSIAPIGSTSAAPAIARSAAGADPSAPAGATRAGAAPITTAAVAAKAATAAKAAPAPTLEQLTDAVATLNQAPQTKAQGLEFSIDTDSKRTVVKLIDQTTKEVLRQFPSPEALEIAKSLDKATGFLIKQTA
ncbi:MAG: flagellar protein FlaG [Pseudomonadota bacterium]